MKPKMEAIQDENTHPDFYQPSYSSTDEDYEAGNSTATEEEIDGSLNTLQVLLDNALKRPDTLGYRTAEGILKGKQLMTPEKISEKSAASSFMVSSWAFLLGLFEFLCY